MATVAQRLQVERLRFPALLPDEQIVFRAWLRLHEKEFDDIDGNVRIGVGQDPGDGFPDSTRKMAVQLTKLRIDAVLRRAADVTLAEVKRRAGPANIGQLLTYRAAWVNENRSFAPPKLLLICNTFTPNILPALKETGIQLEQVAADFSELITRGRPGTRSAPSGT